MRLARTLHKWTALIVGLQVLLWLVSGLVMTVLDERKVSGAITAAFEHDIELLPAQSTIVEPAVVLGSGSRVATEIELQRHTGKWVWRVQFATNVQLFDAANGSPIRIDDNFVRAAAAAGYSGTGKLRAVTLLHEANVEVRGHSMPVWKVEFDDSQRTRFYLSADEGRILERRNDTWRLFDFFWMLHTMDYVGRDNFNNPWVILVAFASVWLAVSGVILLVKSFAPRRKRPVVRAS
jgi:hypothetical protein